MYRCWPAIPGAQSIAAGQQAGRIQDVFGVESDNVQFGHGKRLRRGLVAGAWAKGDGGQGRPTDVASALTLGGGVVCGGGVGGSL